MFIHKFQHSALSARFPLQGSPYSDWFNQACPTLDFVESTWRVQNSLHGSGLTCPPCLAPGDTAAVAVELASPLPVLVPPACSNSLMSSWLSIFLPTSKSEQGVRGREVSQTRLCERFRRLFKASRPKPSLPSCRAQSRSPGWPDKSDSKPLIPK